jgi:hypothetical protein
MIVLKNLYLVALYVFAHLATLWLMSGYRDGVKEWVQLTVIICGYLLPLLLVSRIYSWRLKPQLGFLLGGIPILILLIAGCTFVLEQAMFGSLKDWVRPIAFQVGFALIVVTTIFTAQLIRFTEKLDQ